MGVMTLDELHERTYDLLCTIADICEKEKIRWFVDSGTAIGAVREKDFIPWDDDADIIVMRKDYPAFKAAMEEHLPEHYHIVEPTCFAPWYHDFGTRIFDDRFLLREETEENRVYKNYQNRVNIDVFILENAPNSKLLQSIFKLRCKAVYGMAMSKRYKIHDENYTTLEKIMSSVCIMMGKPFSLETIFALWNKTVTRYSNKDTDYLFPATYTLKGWKFFKKEWFDSNSDTYGQIRDLTVPLPGGYDEWLRMIYGDYMTPDRDNPKYVKHLY